MQIQIKISVGLYTAVIILFIDDLLAQYICARIGFTDGRISP